MPNATTSAILEEGSKYAWVFGDFGACSKDCGTGFQRRKVFCGLINHDTGKQEAVKDDLCDLTNRPIESRSCHNDKPCPATWFVGDWNDCSCIHQKQQRNVFCTSGQANDQNALEFDLPVLPEEKCIQAGPKPTTMKNCKIENCPVWISESWTEVCFLIKFFYNFLIIFYVLISVRFKVRRRKTSTQSSLRFSWKESS